ncbi:MAG: DUF429 domain-containing protein [Azoarcus sp.]|nr:DUF429 domain-containing protein [Azoarcus sp.]
MSETRSMAPTVVAMPGLQTGRATSALKIADWAKGVRLLGVDFTSAPRRSKSITVASGHLSGRGVQLETLERCPDWASYEAVLLRQGPWLGGFDFPFGLPREAVLDLGWPLHWDQLLAHCTALGRARFRAALDGYRQTRPVGRRYAHRATDLPARSHSPMKLVNPPVGLMFLEGAPRLMAAGITLPGMHCGDPARIAIEAYPGLLARSITAHSYKSDEKRKQTPSRLAARIQIAAALRKGEHALQLKLQAGDEQLDALVQDASGDLLDATLALMQAAWCLHAGPPGFGLPPGFDPIEGWIAGA